MTGRSVPEWIGASPDRRIPDRVRLRVYMRAEGRCQCCGRKIVAGDWQADHVVALANGGEHRESNLQCLCTWCHKAKSKQDIAEKSRTYRKRKAHVGLKRRPSRAMPGSRASGWRHRMDGTWERRT